MKYPQEYGRPGNLTAYCSDTNAVYNQNAIERWTKGCIIPFPKKSDLGLAMNYWGITLTSIAAKIYNTLQRNRIEPKIEKILRKNQNEFRRKRFTMSQNLTIRRILEGVCLKIQEAKNFVVDFTKAFDSIYRGKNGANTFHLRPTHQKKRHSHNDTI